MFVRKRLVVSIAVSFLAVLFISACDTTDTGSGNTGTAVTGTVPAPAQASHFKVGDQVKVGTDWLVTVNSATSNKGDDTDQPKAGDVYLVIDVSLKNLSSQSQTISSLLNFKVKDSTGQEYDEALTINLGTPPNGDVAAGDVLRGQISYEVPAAQHQFTFAFIPDLTDTGQSIWDLSI